MWMLIFNYRVLPRVHQAVVTHKKRKREYCKLELGILSLQTNRPNHWLTEDQYRRVELLSACAYHFRWQWFMRLIANIFLRLRLCLPIFVWIMLLYGTVWLLLLLTKTMSFSSSKASYVDITFTKRFGLQNRRNSWFGQEPPNSHDHHVVCLTRRGAVIGHVPRQLSKLFYFFLLYNGRLTCEIVGKRKFGVRLEVPCIYKCLGSEKLTL